MNFITLQEYGLNPGAIQDGEDRRDENQNSSVSDYIKDLKEYRFHPKKPTRMRKRDVEKFQFAVS